MAKKIELKTKQNKQSVSAFLNSIEDEQRKADCKTVAKLMKEVTGEKPVMWGESMVGYGTYEYKRSNGDFGVFMRMAFSPRKTALTIYIMPGYTDHSAILKKLGPHKKGKSCVYLKNLESIDVKVLKKLMIAGWKDMAKLYPK